MQTIFVSASRFADEFASSVDCVSEVCFSSALNYPQNLKRHVV